MTRRDTNAQTEHSRRLRQETAVARRERLKAGGWRQVAVMLPPETLEIIERERARYGGIAATIIAALRKLNGEVK